MHRKHYQKVAETLRLCREEIVMNTNADDEGQGELATVDYVTIELAGTLAQENDLFNMRKFLSAAQVPEDVWPLEAEEPTDNDPVEPKQPVIGSEIGITSVEHLIQQMGDEITGPTHTVIGREADAVNNRDYLLICPLDKVDEIQPGQTWLPVSRITPGLVTVH